MAPRIITSKTGRISDCYVNNARRHYDICIDGSLEYAKILYCKNFDYIGSGHKVWIDGVEYNFQFETHFFADR